MYRFSMKILNRLRLYKILKNIFRTRKILYVLIQVLIRSYMILIRIYYYKLLINIY